MFNSSQMLKRSVGCQMYYTRGAAVSNEFREIKTILLPPHRIFDIVNWFKSNICFNLVLGEKTWEIQYNFYAKKLFF